MSFRVLLRSVTPTLDIYPNKVKLIIQFQEIFMLLIPNPFQTINFTCILAKNRLMQN